MIVYPHGLGDCILATPALRQLKAQGYHIGFATLERFRSASLFDHNPNVDDLFYTQDAWNDFGGDFDKGFAAVFRDCTKQVVDLGYDRVIPVRHSPSGSKILDTAKSVNVDLPDVHTEVYITAEDERIADTFKPGVPYGFVHTHTGVPAKDFPDGWGGKYIADKWGISRTVEVGSDFKYDEIPIGAQFAILRDAERVVVPDSVFFHAACAMDKRVDLAYFAKGKGVYDRVKPLHAVEHNVIWKLPEF
jgi:hypothetical protein